MNHDRIAEVYEGKVGGARARAVARDRVHWLCRQAVGERVLDVGCSQGTATILLARAGRLVVGIDRERIALEAARERASREPEAVRARLELMLAEATALPFADASFDTVLLGEVLEHQVQIGPLLDEAVRVVRPGGHVAITTPYGLSAYHDHKESLYLAALLDALRGLAVVREVGLVERYLAIVAERPASGAAGDPPWELALRVAEQRLAEQDRRVDDQKRRIRDLTARLDRLRAALAQGDERRDPAVRRLRRAAIERRRLTGAVEHAVIRLAALAGVPDGGDPDVAPGAALIAAVERLEDTKRTGEPVV